MFKFIQKFFLKRAIKSKKEISDLERALDESIAQAIKDSASTARIAEKALKNKILQNQTDRTIRKMKELDEYEDDDDDDDEPTEESAEDKIKNTLINSLIENFTGGKNQQKTPETPVNDLTDLAKTLTPEQIKILKAKGFI